jgi:predicted ATPase
MTIKELKIEGFKSLKSITLTEPNPFTVFVGPNAAGKSNIFEAIEFLELNNIMHVSEVLKLFGNPNEIFNQLITPSNTTLINFKIDIGKIKPSFEVIANIKDGNFIIQQANSDQFCAFLKEYNNNKQKEYYWFTEDRDYVHFTNFSRLFINKSSIVKRILQDDSRLNTDASNLEKVLKRIFKNENDREEIIEILQLLIPGFENVEIISEALSGSDNLLVYESSLKKPLNKRLISDGTYNILALIAAVYQSEEPQFLCIEEPENGLNPQVIKELAGIFRDKCAEKGHYIWLNTHSQSLVSELTTEEIVLVDKIKGETRVKQIKGMNLHGLRMDEALLTNVLGGGIPW